MKTIWALVGKLVKDEEGMETVEYAVVAALMTVAGVTVWSTLGSTISTKVQGLVTFVTT